VNKPEKLLPKLDAGFQQDLGGFFNAVIKEAILGLVNAFYWLSASWPESSRSPRPDAVTSPSEEEFFVWKASVFRVRVGKS
jgi:hypothetical protein